MLYIIVVITRQTNKQWFRYIYEWNDGYVLVLLWLITYHSKRIGLENGNMNGSIAFCSDSLFVYVLELRYKVLLWYCVLALCILYWKLHSHLITTSPNEWVTIFDLYFYLPLCELMHFEVVVHFIFYVS